MEFFYEIKKRFYTNCVQFGNKMFFVNLHYCHELLYKNDMLVDRIICTDNIDNMY